MAQPSDDTTPSDAHEAQDDAPDDASAPDPRSDQPADEKQSLIGAFTAFETVLIAGGFVLFLVLLYKMEFPGGDEGFLSPILIAGAGAILLWPLRSHRSVRALMLTGGFLLLVWFMDKVSPITSRSCWCTWWRTF